MFEIATHKGDVMKSFALALVLSCLVLSSGCTGTKGMAGAGAGAATGALIGQAIGQNTEATLVGAAVGTMIGYMIGNEMDKFDQQQLSSVYENGRSGQPVTWKNPDSGNIYKATPQRSYASSKSSVCRDAQIEAIIDGRKETLHSTACRDQYGNWRMKS